MDQKPDKPAIDYPCIWTYKLIGYSDADVPVIVGAVLQDREFDLTTSRSSAAGKYQSHNLSVVVMDDADRVGIYEALARNSRIRIVL